MAAGDTAGERWRQALKTPPLIVAGVINACCALLAEQAGLRALYLSGAGVANACYGWPDLALTTLSEVVEEVRRITAVTALPLLVDIDTGFGPTLMIERTIRELERAGAAAVHIEDQPFAKRCGHRAGKQVVATEVMEERLRAACTARKDPSFFIIARTDALAVEPLGRVIERARAYVNAGADALFVEAVTDQEQYRRVAEASGVPILANLTEFGKTPTWSAEEVYAAGATIALFPLTAFRAMNYAAAATYRCLMQEGTARAMLGSLQTRQELYALLDYEKWEQKV